MIDKIGIEKEAFILKGKEIIEPALYGFPFDEFGFLVEIRSHPYSYASGLLHELQILTKAHEAQAKALGLELRVAHRLKIPKDFIEYLSKEYAYDYLPDLTANINSGTTYTHATGLHNGWATAGLHIHFSRHDERGARIQLPIESIVTSMDASFLELIKKAKRVSGEYEIKKHGFEYRSLPCDAPIEDVVRTAFKILRKV